MDNPFRENATPRIARIRETEETKRQRTLQIEKTKQAARSTEGYWVVRGLAVLCAVGSVIAVSVAGYNAYSDKMRAEHPAAFATPKDCVETAEIVSIDTSSRSCPAGAWYESRPVDNKPGQMFIRCHCGPKPAVTAAPSTSSAP